MVTEHNVKSIPGLNSLRLEPKNYGKRKRDETAWDFYSRQLIHQILSLETKNHLVGGVCSRCGEPPVYPYQHLHCWPEPSTHVVTVRMLPNFLQLYCSRKKILLLCMWSMSAWAWTCAYAQIIAHAAHNHRPHPHTLSRFRYRSTTSS